MKLLLTSAGITNSSIEDALVELLGKPTAEADVLCVTTGSYGHYNFAGAYRFVSGTSPLRMVAVGFKSIGVLELTALPSLDEKLWVPLLQDVDALLVNGGDAGYIAHHARQSSFADLIPTLDAVWVGLSAGSMALTPRIGKDFQTWEPPSGSDETLGVVPFSIFPHVDHPDLPENTMAEAERWAGELGNPAYAIDDDTAIRVVDGVVDIVTEGHWRHFA